MFYVNTVISVIIVGCFVSFFEGFWEKTWERSTFARWWPVRFSEWLGISGSSARRPHRFFFQSNALNPLFFVILVIHNGCDYMQLKYCCVCIIPTISNVPFWFVVISFLPLEVWNYSIGVSYPPWFSFCFVLFCRFRFILAIL